MAYTRHNWVCGEIVTAELLNNIEDGIEEALECCGGSTEPLTIHLHPNGCLDDEYSNPTGSEIFEWCSTHNTRINGNLYATDINIYSNGELLDRTFEGTASEWWVHWQNGSDSCYFRVYSNGQIECGIEG